MQMYEYKVVPAPTRGEKARGVKTPVERFALTMAGVMNDLAADGWEYLRTDTLPSEERSGLTRRTTVYHTVLVFRRPRAEADAAPALLTAPAARPALTAEAPMGDAPAIRPAAEGRAPALGAAKERG